MNTTFAFPAGVLAAVFALLSGTTMAQDATSTTSADQVQAGDAGAVPNPHALLPPLEGGPDGSPTGRRGNPLPGTSTSIPTTNPATVAPLANKDGTYTNTENTGIEGQCDPVVRFRECPQVPQISADGTTVAPEPLGEDVLARPE